MLNILKNRDKILDEFEANESTSTQKNVCKTDNEEMNKLTRELFQNMSRSKLPDSVPILQEKVLQFAKDLGNTKFKSSNDWLESFRKHANIDFYVKSGEKADFDVVIVEDWKEKLSTLLEGYNPCDIFNMDETDLFFCTTENKTFHQKCQENNCSKKVKNMADYISLCKCGR